MTLNMSDTQFLSFSERSAFGNHNSTSLEHTLSCCQSYKEGTIPVGYFSCILLMEQLSKHFLNKTTGIIFFLIICLFFTSYLPFLYKLSVSSRWTGFSLFWLQISLWLYPPFAKMCIKCVLCLHFFSNILQINPVLLIHCYHSLLP